MIRLAIFLLICLCLPPHGVCSGEFVLRLEEVGYDRTTDGDTGDENEANEPVPQVRSTLRVLIRPGERFSGTAQIDACKLSIRGRCKRGEQPDQLILDISGGRYISTNSMRFWTTSSLKVGEPHILGGTVCKDEQNFNGAVRRFKSASKLILTITEEDWDDDDVQEPRP